MHNFADADWDAWNRKMRRALIETQAKTGCATGSWDPERPTADRWGSNGGRLMTTSFSTLCLEIYYRYLPLFKTDSLVPKPPGPPGLAGAPTTTPDHETQKTHAGSALESAAHCAAATGTALGTQAGTPFDFARLLIILPATHLFLDSASLHQLAKTTHRLLNRLPLTQRQFDHSLLLRAKGLPKT